MIVNAKGRILTLKARIPFQAMLWYRQKTWRSAPMTLKNQIDRRQAIGLAGVGLAYRAHHDCENKDPQVMPKKRSEDFHGLKVGLASYSDPHPFGGRHDRLCQRVGIKYIALKIST